MRLFVQRVREAEVTVEGTPIGTIGPGMLVLVGFCGNDGPDLPSTRLWTGMLDKLLGLRIFPDADDKMNLSLEDFGGSLLLVSQFTLYADCRKGRRPSFHLAAHPTVAEPLFTRFVADAEARLPGRVQQGRFGAMMAVRLENWGPTSLMLDSAELFQA